MEMHDCLNSKSTLDKTITYYMDNYVKNFYADSTYKSYKTKMDKYVLPYIGDRIVKQLKRIDIQNLVYQLISNEKSLSVNSIRQVHGILHKFLNFAVRDELIVKNVSSGVRLPTQTKYTPRIYSKAEVKMLLENTKDSFLYIPICLAVKAGLRRSEILALQWQDFNPNESTLIIRKSASTNSGQKFNGTKSLQSMRTLKIPSSLCMELKKHRDEQRKLLKEAGCIQSDSTLMICKCNGKPYNPTYVSRKFTEILTVNNLSAIRFHDLRHAYATNAHNSGMPIKHLSSSLGHSSSAITVENYVHISDKYSL